MRPKKVVILAEENETHLSTLAFLLEVRGRYRVLRAQSAAAALWLAASMPCIDLLVCELVLPGSNDLARSAKRLHPDMRVLVYTRTESNFARMLHADAFHPKHGSPAELLERLRVLLIRKRGPKKIVPEVATLSNKEAAA
jgi:DNA-binding NarL/FixJ family response regulator